MFNKMSLNVSPVTVSCESKRTELSLPKINFLRETALPATAENSAIAAIGC